MAFRHVDYSYKTGRKEEKQEERKEGRERRKRKNEEYNIYIYKKKDEEQIQKKTKGIKADSQKVPPVIEGLNNSMNSIVQELKNKIINQQDEIKREITE